MADWVTEDEMTAALAGLLGSDAKAVFEHSSDGAWTFGDWGVTAHNGDHDEDGRVDAELTKTDPGLPPGVVYEAAWGFAHGFYILAGPNSDESLCMTLMPAEASFGYPSESEAAAHEDRIFALASMMLREMGWAA